ncbi:hypothetical protein [Bacillus sp. P14.5]|uniref:hypothetical protein n=1 Tax=Bacillus sp. P14.5 TaxID=1983400 RepID=UPI000DEB6990|nr:hypothetical protein [Bacillus sp. P14.5]
MIDWIVAAAFAVAIIYKINKNRDLLKTFTKTQIFCVAVSYIAATIAAFVCIYFFGNWIASFVQNSFIRFIIFFAVIITTMFVCISILNRALKKITNGVLPGK